MSEQKQLERVAEIESQTALAGKFGIRFGIQTSDVAYLLAELRKRDEALARVGAVAARLHWEADNANEGAKYAAEVNQGAYLMALESERFAYQKAERLIRAAVTGDGA